jgi:mannose-6-phosphate isomerase-like protein (cupin superfamily)
MKATFTIEPFSLAGAAVHIPPAGTASLLQADAIKAHLQRLPEGHLLGVFPIATSDDLHSDIWEMHPAGDEVLIMLTGELGVEYSDGSRRGTSSLQPSHGIVMPKGVWHRLVLREPGLLLALSPPQGTQSSHNPEGGHETSIKLTTKGQAS